jgi:hypothetical protein
LSVDEEKRLGVLHRLTRLLWKWGVEIHGCVFYRRT